MSMNKTIHLTPVSGGSSQQLVLVAATSQASAAMAQDGYMLVTVDSLTFMRPGTVGTTPTALGTGVDQVLLANNMYRIGPLLAGQKLAFISAAGGNAYLTPQG